MYLYTHSDKMNAVSENHVVTFPTKQGTSFCGVSILIYKVIVGIQLYLWVLWLIF
jgi:hypothetical protein